MRSLAVSSTLLTGCTLVRGGAMLFVGDDWAEDHHDIEIVDETGRRVARQRLPEGLSGVSRLHALIAAAMPAEWAELETGEAAGRVKIGIETDRGPWVAALVAAGYEVFAINPMSTARYRERHCSPRHRTQTVQRDCRRRGSLPRSSAPTDAMSMPERPRFRPRCAPRRCVNRPR